MTFHPIKKSVGPDLQLQNGGIDIWLCRIAPMSNTLQHRYLSQLNDVEKLQWQGFAIEKAREQYLVSRVLIRTVLSIYAGVPEHAWEFQTNEYGRPFISGPDAFSNLHFSLSHTDGLLALAVSMNSEIGIDVENTGKKIDPIKLASDFFAPIELADISASSPPERLERFFSYWTLKEAYIKARGQGLAIPLDSFWFEKIDDFSPCIFFSDIEPHQDAPWMFQQFRPTSEHQLALAFLMRHNCEHKVQISWVTPLPPLPDTAIAG